MKKKLWVASFVLGILYIILSIAYFYIEVSITWRFIKLFLLLASIILLRIHNKKR